MMAREFVRFAIREINRTPMAKAKVAQQKVGAADTVAGFALARRKGGQE